MLTLAIVIVVILLIFTASVFLLGFRLGGEHWQAELTKARMDSARAQAAMHRLTRSAFDAMARHVERPGR